METAAEQTLQTFGRVVGQPRAGPAARAVRADVLSASSRRLTSRRHKEFCATLTPETVSLVRKINVGVSVETLKNTVSAECGDTNAV